MSLKNKLLQMKGHMQLPSQTKTDNLIVTSKDLAWSQLSSKRIFFEEQSAIFREVQYPIDYKLGRHRFSELKEVVQLWNDEKVNHPLATNGVSAEELLFFDTETTGLGTGVGNSIFLIGYCQLQGDFIKVRQFFLPGPADEAALYYHFLENSKDLANLVTYNGKAFDWPQVKTRHTFVRNRVRELPMFGHFDLLHASRRLWKKQLPSCRLSIVEKEILQIERHEDTPGSLAPLLYFDYLKNGNPKLIEGVVKHNEQDVLSLIVLYIHLSKKLLNKESRTAAEAFEIARWFEKEKEFTRAQALYEEAARGNSRNKPEAMLALGNLLKKDKQLDEAENWFLLVARSEGASGVAACIELAKLYEHKLKEYSRALAYAELAYCKQKAIARLLRDKQLLKQLAVRIARLKEK